MPYQEENDGFEVIVVGGGLAGLAAAYTLAERGVEVLVLERGDYCGAKNVTGGRIYLNPIRELFPDLLKNAPLERYIAHEEVSLFAPSRSVTLRYDGSELKTPPTRATASSGLSLTAGWPGRRRIKGPCWSLRARWMMS